MGLRPRPRWGAYTLPRPLAGFRGPTSKGGEGRKRRGKEERGKERTGER